MSPKNIIRAWKDAEYRLSLNQGERALLPAHPAGFLELTEGDLVGVVGGFQYKVPDDVGTVDPETGCPKLQTCRW